MKSDYKPIPCTFHDHLTDLAVLRTSCRIVYAGPNDEALECQSIIKDIYTKKGEEFIVLENDLSFRLDRLRSINGRLAEGDACGTNNIVR